MELDHSGISRVDEDEPPQYDTTWTTMDRLPYTEDYFDVDEEPKPTLREKFHTCTAKHCSCSKNKLKKISYSILPILEWLPKYEYREWRTHILGDLFAGITVAIMNIPQGMSYALLASMAPVVGLYLSFFSPLIYAMTGTSRHLAYGTFSVISLMSGAAVERVVLGGLADGGGLGGTNMTNSSQAIGGSPHFDVETEKLRAATALAFLVGLIQVLMGLCQLGFVAIYLSHPLVRGFTTAAGVHVGISQIKYIFGLSEYVENQSGIFSIINTLVDVFEDIAKTNYVEFFISVFCIMFLAYFKFVSKKYQHKIKFPIPVELFAVIIFAALSSPLKLEKNHGVDVVGDIPTGMPPPRLPGFEYLSDLIGDAIAISIVSFSINISMARLFAQAHDYKVSPNVEMRAYGLTNLISSFFNCFSSSGSLTRSLVQDQTGGKSQLASIVNSVIILVVLLSIGHLFESLPKAVLASIVIVNLKGLVLQFIDLPLLWKKDKLDFAVWTLTFAASVLLGIDYGLMIGVVFNMLTVILRLQFAHSSLLGNVSNTEIYKTISHKQAQEVDGVKIFNFEAPVCYANSEYFKSKLFKATGIHPHTGEVKRAIRGNVHTIVVDMSACSFLDTVGAHILQELAENYLVNSRINFVLANCSAQVASMLQTNPADEEALDRCQILIYASTHDAVMAAGLGHNSETFNANGANGYGANNYGNHSARKNANGANGYGANNYGNHSARKNSIETQV